MTSDIESADTTEREGVREAELVRAASALLNNLWQDVWSHERTHEENWRAFDRKYPGVKWLRDARDAALSSAPAPAPAVVTETERNGVRGALIETLDDEGIETTDRQVDLIVTRILSVFVSEPVAEGEAVLRITKRGSLIETEPMLAAFDLLDGVYDLFAHPPAAKARPIVYDEDRRVEVIERDVPVIWRRAPGGALEYALDMETREVIGARIFLPPSATRDVDDDRHNHWPDPLESPQAEAIRSGKIDDTQIRDLFDKMERELKLHRERARR